MSESLCILGRQPALGLAELESLLGPKALTSLTTKEAAVVNQPIDKPLFDRLGGTVKVAKLLHIHETNRWADIEAYLLKSIPNHLKFAPEGKLNFGLSVYGLDVKPRDLSNTGLKLKKLIKGQGKSVRFVASNGLALNSAQVIHNKLNQGHWELVFVRDGRRVLMGLTIHEQDIEAYGARDQARPKRDARVGMLPPKLAQILINLALPSSSSTLLDPFCGTGVVLQEALLMGIPVIGTDLEPRMVEYSQINIDWLFSTYTKKIPLRSEGLLPEGRFKLEVGEVTSHQWPKLEVIASETYLGRPFAQEPDRETLNKVMQDVDTIHKKFLRNITRQTKSGFRMCIAVPAWKTRQGFKHLPTLDSLEELGYTRMRFSHVSNRDMVYHREDQIVGRELVVLIRK